MADHHWAILNDCLYDVYWSLFYTWFHMTFMWEESSTCNFYLFADIGCIRVWTGDVDGAGTRIRGMGWATGHTGVLHGNLHPHHCGSPHHHRVLHRMCQRFHGESYNFNHSKHTTILLFPRAVTQSEAMSTFIAYQFSNYKSVECWLL